VRPSRRASVVRQPPWDPTEKGLYVDYPLPPTLGHDDSRRCQQFRNVADGPCRSLHGFRGRNLLIADPLSTKSWDLQFALSGHKEYMKMKPKNTICLWFDKDAHEAARFYAATFPDSKVTAVHKAPGDYPSGKEGDVLTVEFTVLGIPCLGLNGGPEFRHSEAFSFQIATDNQEETDRYWNAIVGNGGKESQCGWCKDRWGLSWQITPRALTDALAAGGGEAKRAFEAMMPMKKIDVATIEAARRG
jgi:predicted 3-demethylubiquinone-9 3-methyltransferase (glyoxalase superfamily)